MQRDADSSSMEEPRLLVMSKRGGESCSCRLLACFATTLVGWDSSQPQPHRLASCKSMKADRDNIVEWTLSNKGFYACASNGPIPILSHTEPLNVTNALWGWRTILVAMSKQRHSCIAKLGGVKTPCVETICEQDGYLIDFILL